MKYPYDTYTITVSTGFSGATHYDEYHPNEDFTESVWNSLPDREKESYLNDVARDYCFNVIEYSIQPKE